jgi:hypothetical protein
VQTLRKGILIQGPISKWTKDIVSEYQKHFPDAHIHLSTWVGENIKDISCDISRIVPPPIPSPHKSTINFQIIGTQEGLKKIDGDIILKCRPDQFIHNEKIFDMFEKSCSKNKIMIPNYGTYESFEYRTSDFCQLAAKSILSDYWNSMPLFDGSFAVEAARHLTKNYVVNVRKDNLSWQLALRKYFHVKDFHSDFQIEWEKINKLLDYQELYSRASLIRAPNDM